MTHRNFRNMLPIYQDLTIIKQLIFESMFQIELINIEYSDLMLR